MRFCKQQSQLRSSWTLLTMSTAENDPSLRRFALLGGDDGVWSIAGLAFRSDRRRPAREARQVRYRRHWRSAASNAVRERVEQPPQGTDCTRLLGGNGTMIVALAA